jgi:hypothetical protein
MPSLSLLSVCTHQEDEESKREGMQLVRGQVATVLKNYYKDTLVAPSGAPMPELVDKTSLKASQVYVNRLAVCSRTVLVCIASWRLLGCGMFLSSFSCFVVRLTTTKTGVVIAFD